jgi:hypothetical protein
MTRPVDPPEDIKPLEAPFEPRRIGNWDPCFKPGPCPCSDPCAWVKTLGLPGKA